MRKMFDKIADVLLKPVSEAVTAQLGIYTILWGLWVLNPFIDTFSAADVYSQLLAFIPFEWAWALIAIFFGIITLMGLAKHKPRPVFLGAAASAVYWFIIAIFYMMGDLASTNGLSALFLAVLSTYIYLNCKLNYKYDLEDPGTDD